MVEVAIDRSDRTLATRARVTLTAMVVIDPMDRAKVDREIVIPPETEVRIAEIAMGDAKADTALTMVDTERAMAQESRRMEVVEITTAPDAPLGAEITKVSPLR